VNSADSDRFSALHLAAQEGCTDCVKLLLDHGADLRALSRHGDTPLALAARHGQSLSVVHCKGQGQGSGRRLSSPGHTGLSHFGFISSYALFQSCILKMTRQVEDSGNVVID